MVSGEEIGLLSFIIILVYELCVRRKELGGERNDNDDVLVRKK